MAAQTTYSDLEISTGFLSGNLFSDEAGVDVYYSAERYADALAAALQAAYPGATIHVDWQDAVGSLPYGLQTHVRCGGDNEETDLELERIAEGVDYLCAEVWEDGAWIVEIETEA